MTILRSEPIVGPWDFVDSLHGPLLSGLRLNTKRAEPTPEGGSIIAHLGLVLDLGTMDKVLVGGGFGGWH